MLCAVEMGKADICVYDTEDLSLERLPLKNVLNHMKNTDYKGILGVGLLNNEQKHLVDIGNYKEVIGITQEQINRGFVIDDSNIYLTCDFIKPYYTRETLSFNRPNFKLYFKSGEVLLIWVDGYLYKIIEKDNKVFMNGKETGIAFLPKGLSYIVQDGDSYSIYLRYKWLNIEGKYLRYCLNQEVYYGSKVPVSKFMEEYKKYK